MYVSFRDDVERGQLKLIFVPTDDLKVGMRLAKPIYNKNGVLLYERNTKLTLQGIYSVKNFELIGLYILEPAEPLPPMTPEDIEFERFQTMAVFSIKDDLKSIKDGKNSSLFFRILRGIGLGGIGVTSVIDVIRFYVGNNSDNGRFVRLGLLIFIICYGGSCLEKSIDTFRMGAKAEVISRLAYQDGLTELGNRTAFDECLEQVELDRQREHIEIGIAMFDVNNLKAINDMIGHQMGDQLIKSAADILRNSYGKEGQCFRVGGDEFVAIITGTQVMERCEECRKQCEAMIAEANNSKELPFYIRIASGYNVYIPGQVEHQTLKEIYRMADARMYENKKRMKREDPNAPIVKKGETMRLKKFSGETSRLFGHTVILKAEDNPAANKESRS